MSDSKAEAASLQDQLQCHQQDYTQTTTSFQQQQAATALQHEQHMQQVLQQQQQDHKAALQTLLQQHQAKAEEWGATQKALQGAAVDLQGRLETASQDCSTMQKALEQLQKQVRCMTNCNS